MIFTRKLLWTQQNLLLKEDKKAMNEMVYLEELMGRREPSVFYSGDLCAKYFTTALEGESRFVLFDDAGTLRRKMQLGQELGLTTGLVMYPEVEDILPDLFGR